MLFNSLDFALFFPVVFLLYWTFAKHLTVRNAFLLAASYFFYGWWDWRFLFLIAFSSLVDFFVGKYLYKATGNTRRKVLLWTSISVNIGLLAYFKYANFFIESFVDSFRLFGQDLEVAPLQIILPVGISFYTFQTLSYTIDIYKRKLEPTNNALAFFTFVAFFPQLVAGPIERASHLLPQFFKTYKFNYHQVKSGLLLMAFGLFKKMVIADRAAILVNQVYGDPGSYDGYQLVVATFFFAVQIYCDFSGYSDIAIGIARTMGFDLMKNFDSPYFSKSITEFWRRWHISLSTWFRDYVYIPLGGSRGGTYKTYANLFIVFLVSGLWHGAAFTFVIWGAIHGVIIVLEKAFTKQRENLKNGFQKLKLSKLYAFGSLLVTFFIVCVAWVFFRAESLREAGLILRNSVDLNYGKLFHGGLGTMGLAESEIYLLLVLIVLLVLFELRHRTKPMAHYIARRPIYVRWSLYLVVVFSLLLFGIYGDDQVSEFIYFQF
ncbi:MBOAT family O-acyltransferase [Altibacter lentus]|uniref:MBOAT family O-acyltransferase n=1 Tax=Altibacter lentus TaxID=1223410 RepID=UPI000556C13E|nr:MBOAT family O-acyltransferase [Altibacter lentus]